MLLLAYALTQFIDVWNRVNYTNVEKSDENALTYYEHSFGKD